jgi:hypothetical protein
MTAPQPRNPDRPAPSSTKREVRAGPGDTGARDRPTPLPKAPRERDRGRRGVILLLVLVLLAGLALILRGPLG